MIEAPCSVIPVALMVKNTLPATRSKWPEQLDRHSVVAWVRSVIDELASAERNMFRVETVAPAGMPIQLLLDDPSLALPYCGRLVGWGTTAPVEATHFVVTGPHLVQDALPKWSDDALPAADFDALMASAGLRASFQDHNWRIFDTAARIGAQISFREGALRPWHAGLLLIDWTVQSAGFSLVHAGTLGLNGRGLLLVGQSGSGKSGTTLAGLAEGLQTVGDDFVALRCDGEAVTRSVFPLGRQDPAGLDRIPGLRDRVAAHRVNHLGKFEFDLRDTFPGAFVDELSVDAVVLPVISEAAAPSIRPISASDAMVELLRSNPFRYIGDPSSRVARFATLARGRPCFRLELSADGTKNGRALRSLVETMV